jgi:F-type H+-transporting ATPase subunit delta
MDSVSRESYSAAVQRLDGLVTGDRAATLPGVADEILSVALLLGKQPRLRRALSDPSRSADDRAGLLGSVINAKVSDDAATLLRTLVAGRWSSSSELLTAAERLGVEGVLAGAQSAGDLAEVEDELFRFGQVVDGDNELASAPSRSRCLSGRRWPIRCSTGRRRRPRYGWSTSPWRASVAGTSPRR